MIVRRRLKPPTLPVLLHAAINGESRPTAIVLAGHNGSGKSSLWYERLANDLKLPLINADRLTASILPERDGHHRLPVWAQDLRDKNVAWQTVAQQGVKAFRQIVMAERMSFAFETVFSHWKLREDGTFESKLDDILEMQTAGYFVVLLFVGLDSVAISSMRVETRRLNDGHDVPYAKLKERFPRTQAAVGHAAPHADLTIMFDNSRGLEQAFSLVRAQRKKKILFDTRDDAFKADHDLRQACQGWMERVCGPAPTHPGVRYHG